ncbi:hypothetical protein BC829DRAFT_408001 [Chytridium lagenaria]|nr:hypothetical protein BC829DRAFT_408001 [Chytridium lagenaria]
MRSGTGMVPSHTIASSSSTFNNLANSHVPDHPRLPTPSPPPPYPPLFSQNSSTERGRDDIDMPPPFKSLDMCTNSLGFANGASVVDSLTDCSLTTLGRKRTIFFFPQICVGVQQLLRYAASILHREFNALLNKLSRMGPTWSQSRYMSPGLTMRHMDCLLCPFI